MKRDQSGFATPVVLAMLVLIALTALASIDGAGALVAAVRARAAADAAALAAAASEWPFLDPAADPIAAAEAIAAENGAAVEVCDCPIRGERATVTVSVPTIVRVLRVVPPRMRASATARVRPAVIFEGGPQSDQ